MDSTLRTVTQLLHQLVIHQPPRDPYNDKDKLDILGGRGGGNVGGGDYGELSAYGDTGCIGYDGTVYSGGSDGHDFTGSWSWSNNDGGSSFHPARDLGTNDSSLQPNGGRDPETVTHTRPDSTSRDVGNKVATDDDRNHHPSSSQLLVPSLSLSTNSHHHGDVARWPTRQPKDTLSIAPHPRSGVDRSCSPAVAEEVDLGASITSLFGNEVPGIYDPLKSHIALDESSLDLSQPPEYGLHPAYTSAEHQTLLQTPFRSETREDTAPAALSSSFLHPRVPDNPIWPHQAGPPKVQQEESRQYTSAKWDDDSPVRHEVGLHHASDSEGTEEFAAHDGIFASPAFHPQPVKPLEFACPYFKFDPATYGQRKTCRGASYDTTHRLKEHLYRSHKQKPRCLRCGEIFSRKSDRNKHLSQAIACNVVEGITADGFDSDQEKELRSKKRKRNSLKTEEDKWEHIFRVLFGDSVAVPQPYYTYHTASQGRGNDSLMMSHSDVTRILSDDVPRDLEEQAFSEVEAICCRTLSNTKRHQLLDVFRRLFVKKLTGQNRPAYLKENVRTRNGPKPTSNNIAGASDIDPDILSTHGVPHIPDSRGQTMASTAYCCDRILSCQNSSPRNEIVDGRQGGTSLDGGQALVHSTSNETGDGHKYDAWPTDMDPWERSIFDEFNGRADDFLAIASMNGF